MSTRKQIAENQKILYDDAVANNMFQAAVPSFEEFQKRLERSDYQKIVYDNYRKHDVKGTGFNSLEEFRGKFGGSFYSDEAKREFNNNAQYISDAAKQSETNFGKYNKLKQRKQKQKNDFGRVTIGSNKTPFGGNADDVVKDDFAIDPATGKTGAYITSDDGETSNLADAQQRQAALDSYNETYQKAVDTGEIPSVFDVRDKDGNYDLQENIGKDGTYLTEEGTQAQLDKKLADAYARKEELEKAIAEDDKKNGNPLLSYSASIGGSNGRDAKSSDYRNQLAISLSLVKQQIGSLEAVKQYPTSSMASDAWKALDNTAFSAKTWDFGITDFATMGQMERIKSKMDNKIPLTTSEQTLLKSKLGADAAEALEDEKMGNVYRWTKIAGQSLPFMLDFFLTGGYGGITDAISKSALKFAAKKGMGKISAAVLKNTGVVLGDIAGSYAMAGTTQAFKTGADIMQRHMGNLYQDENGNYAFGTFDENGNLVHEGGESFGTALYKGLTSAMVENYTEKLFGHSYGVKKGALAFMEKHGMAKSAEFFKNIGKKEWYAGAKKWMGKFGINGFGEEVMEEEIGIPLHALLDGDNKFSDLWDARQQLDIIGGMAISVGSMYAMGAGTRPLKGVYNRAQYYRFKHEVTAADNEAFQLLGEDYWPELRERMDNATNEQMGGVLYSILQGRDTLSKEQIKAAIMYGVNLMKMRGYNLAKTAEMNAREMTGEQETNRDNHDNEIENAYSEGHDADGDVTHTIQLEQNESATRLAGLLGITEEQLHDMSDDELEAKAGENDELDEAIYDYQISTAKYQGVMDNANDKVDMAGREAALMIDQRTDLSRGTVRTASIKATQRAEDYDVFIISGNLATHDDGTVDISGSDQMILYYDPKTGRKEYADPSRFASVGEEQSAEEAKNQAVMEAKDKVIREQAGIIDGKVEEGSTFTITDADGTEHTYEVLADNGDGTAMITLDGNVEYNPYSLNDLQQLKDAEDQKKMIAARQQRAELESQRQQQKQNEQKQNEENQARISQTISEITDNDGNVVIAAVEGEEDADSFIVGEYNNKKSGKKKYKVVTLNADGTVSSPRLVDTSKVTIMDTMPADEYQQVLNDTQTTVIEDNGGLNDNQEDSLGDELPPVPDNVTINGDGTYSVDGEVQGKQESHREENTPASPSFILSDGTEVPMREDGNPDTTQMTAAQTAEFYDTQFGEDAEGLINGWVSDAKKALDTANKMTVKGKDFVEQKASKDAKTKAIADAQAKYDSAQAIADAYKERMLAKQESTAEGRRSILDKAKAKYNRLKGKAEQVQALWNETVGSVLHRLYDHTGVDVFDNTPQTIEEYVSSSIAPFSLNYEGNDNSKGVKQETGLERKDFAKSHILAAEGKGTTVDEFVHKLWENRPAQFESTTDQDIRSALLDLITSDMNAYDMRHVIENNRIAQAEKAIEDEQNAAESAAHEEGTRAAAEEEAPTETETTEAEEGAPAEVDDALPFAPSDESDVPFSERDNNIFESQQERAENVEKNHVDDTEVVDAIVGKKVRKALERIAKMMGAKIQWQYSDKTGNGWYDEATNTIYLTLDSSITEGVQFIFGHEMTHEIKTKNPAAYEELKTLVKDMLGEDTFETMTDVTEQKYRDAGIIYTGGREAYEEEVVADQIGTWLNDANYAHTLALKMSHPLLAAIHDIIVRIKMAFNGTEYTDNAKQILRTIEQAYEATANREAVNTATQEGEGGQRMSPMFSLKDAKEDRIQKLRESKPIEISGKEITPSDDLKQYKKNAKEYGKTLQGTYTNEDTGVKVQLQRGRRNGGVNEVLQHDYKDIPHLQSVAAIPQIIRKSIYIDSEENTDKEKNPAVSEYQYYVCGLKIGGVDYTVRSVFAMDNNGNRYYDHKLTDIEKGKLLDLIDQGVNDSSFDATSSTELTTANNSVGKDKKLLHILQANNQESAENSSSKTKFSLKGKPVRFEAGKSLSEDEKKEVLATMKDAYKVNGVSYHIEETAGGKEKRVYEATAADYVKSDITNRPLRYYITLPDGRIAHPSEVYPNISDHDVRSSVAKQETFDKEAADAVERATASISNPRQALEILNELQALSHETRDAGYGMSNATSYDYKTGLFTSNAPQAIDYVVRRMRRKGDVPAELVTAVKNAVANSFGMVDNVIDHLDKKANTTIEDAISNGNADITDSTGEVVAQTDADHKAKFSLRTWLPWTDNLGRTHEGTRQQVLDYMKEQGFSKEDITDMQDTMDYWYNYMSQIANFTNPDGSFKFRAFHQWNEKQPQYKKVGKNIENVVSTKIKNGEYAVNQELSTDCIKREAFTKLVNTLIARGADLSMMGPAQINTIKNMMRKYGIQVACDLCFVEGKRLQIVNWAQTIVDDWNRALEAIGLNLDELDDFNFGGYAYDEEGNLIDDATFVPTEEYADSSQYRAINEAYDILTGHGKDHYDAMKKRNTANWKAWLKENKVAEKWEAKHKGMKWSEEYLTKGQKKVKTSFLNFGVNDPKKIYHNTQEYASRYTEMEQEYLAEHPDGVFEPNKKQQAELDKLRNKQIKTIFAKMQRLIAEHPEMRKKMKLSDLLGSKGLMQIRQENGDAFAQLWSLILGRFGSGTPKPIQDAVPYSGEIFEITDGLISQAYVEGGARMFSFSDFDITKVFDIMQIYWDMAARKMKLQSYSKEAAYVIMFGKSGAKINMSTLPKAVVSDEIQQEYDNAKNDDQRKAARKKGQEYAGLIVDKDGNITDMSWSEEHSLKPSFCQQIFRDPERNGNCGAVTVGASVNHCVYAAAQPWIRMVIPFHLSGMPIEARRRTDVNWYFDNTEHQNTRVNIKGKQQSINSPKLKGYTDYNFYANEESEDWDMRTECRNYLKWCDEKGYTPRFEWGIDSDHYRQWCEKNGYQPNQQIVDIMDNDMTDGVWNGYYKFITDFNAYKPVLDEFGNPTFDENGHLIETTARHTPVTTNITLSEAERKAVFGNLESDSPSVLQNRENSITHADANMNKMAAEVMDYLNVVRDNREGKVSDAEVEKAEADMKGENNTFFAVNDAELLMDAENADNGTKFSLKQEKESIIAEAKKNGTYLKAPNGEDTNLDSDQWATVRTSNFKNWFGDWEKDPEHASKVVDENGEPKVVYHYTDENFTEFKEENVGKNTFGNATDAYYAATTAIGTWFTDNNKQPAYMGEPMQVFLNARKPFDCESLENLAASLSWYITEEDKQFYEEDWENHQAIIEAGKEFQREKIKDGYDSVVIDDEEFGGTSYVSFSANQIKSADNNNGDFSTENNDIRYSLKEVNDKFNDRLEELIKNPNQKDKILRLGHASTFLQDGGIADADTELEFDKFVRKSDEDYKNQHPFNADDLKNMPLALAEPIAVFESTNANDHVVLTELQKDGKNFIVAIRIVSQNRKGGIVLEVNQITSLYPKKEKGIVHWINTGRISNVNKEKALHFIEALQPHAGTTITSEELETAVKVIKDYGSSKQSSENSPSEQKFSLRADRFRHDLNEWKKANNLPKDAQRPTVPVREPNETAADFMNRVKEYRKEMAVWKTAPTYEGHLLTDDTAQGEFNRELQRGAVQVRIALQDSMLAIRKAQEAIMKEVGVDKLSMAEDAYTAENRSHGKGKNEFEEYNDEFLQPLRKAYNALMKKLGKSYDNVKVYMIAKHGLERNAHMAFAKALEKDYDKQSDRIDAYNAYKGDVDRLLNDTDYQLGQIDFTTWRQRDNAIRLKYAPSYMDYRYDKMGITQDYSGLSALFDGSDFEEAAADLVKDVETNHPDEADDLWWATNDATKKVLRDSYKAGMMTKDVYEYVRDMYRNYIPLRGWGDTNADQVWNYVGGGKGAFSQTLKEAHGRESLADDPIAYIENMAESGILLNNKNWVKQHLLLLAENHPTSLLNVSKAWYVKTTDAQGNEQWIPASPQITANMTAQQVELALEAFEQKMEQMKQNGDATQKREHLEISYPQTNGEEREHEVRVMRNGEEYVIYINGDPQLAQAMNNTRAQRVREGLQNSISQKVIAWVGRKMAAAYTSLSPLFIPSNYARDLTMTLASSAIREDARYNYLLRKNMLTHWNTLPLVLSYQNGTLREKVRNGSATKTEQMFYDYMMNGGETGFVSSLDVEDLKKKFKNELKDMNRMAINPKKVGHVIMDSIETLNRAIEGSNRFMVYMTSIQYGRSIEEAVNNAKDVTLNFNRKGTGEHGWQTIRNLYLFINPAIQSLQTLGALAKHHPFKFTAVTTAWLASGVLVPVINGLMMSMLGGDDDKDKYWSFTKWDRRNNMILWVPFTHEFFKIPLAQEFRGFYGVGDMIASKLMGGEKAEQSWGEYAEDFLGQVVDMLPLDPTGYDGNIAVSLMPNPIRPFFELAFNVDFTGKPLFKDSEYNKYDPNFTKAYVGTPDWLVRISKMVNSIGNDYPDVQQNAIDKFGDPRYNLNNPAVVDHILSSYLGGAYTMGSQVLGVATKLLNGDEVKMADVPILSKFVSNPDDRPASKKQGDEFWTTKERHDRAANTLSKLKKKAKVDGDYTTLEMFFSSDEYKQYKEDDKVVKKYEADKKKEKAEESGEEYKPHKTTYNDVYKAHATPRDDFEDLKLSQLYQKVKGFSDHWNELLDEGSSLSQSYYEQNADAIQSAEDTKLIIEQMNGIKKDFLVDGKDTYSAEDMKELRDLRKQALSILGKVKKGK